MIILRNKYFSNEDNKNKNKKLAIGAAIGTTGAVAGGIAGKILGNKTRMDAQEKSIYDRHKGNTSGIDSEIRRLQDYNKNVLAGHDLKVKEQRDIIRKNRREIHTDPRHLNYREQGRKLRNLYHNKDMSDIEYRRKNARRYKEFLNTDPYYQSYKNNIKNAQQEIAKLKQARVGIEKRVASRESTIAGLKNEKSTIEKILKRKKANSRVGLAIGAGAGAALATGAYLLGNKYTIKSRNHDNIKK